MARLRFNYYPEFPFNYPTLFGRTPGLELPFGPGWKRHVAKLFARLEEIALHRPGFHIISASAQAGELRVLTAPADVYARHLAHQAAKRCLGTCECCGVETDVKHLSAIGSPRCPEHETYVL